MIHLIYLASGSARRFGANKLLEPFRGKPLAAHGLDLLCGIAESRADCRVTVVSRYPAVRQMAEARGAHAADSPRSEEGMSFTIRTALDAVEPLQPGDCMVFVVADQPLLRRETVERMLDATAQGARLGTVACGEREGNPGLFGAEYADELRALTGDRGGRAVLKRHAAQCVRVEAEDEELYDIDTVEMLREKE